MKKICSIDNDFVRLITSSTQFRHDELCWSFYMTGGLIVNSVYAWPPEYGKDKRTSMLEEHRRRMQHLSIRPKLP